VGLLGALRADVSDLLKIRANTTWIPHPDHIPYFTSSDEPGEVLQPCSDVTLEIARLRNPAHFACSGNKRGNAR